MSRRDFPGKKYHISLGVDHVTGPFIQVWSDFTKQDMPTVAIDGLGVRISGDDHSQRLLETHPAVTTFLDETGKRFETARGRGNHRPNLDAETIYRLVALVGEEEPTQREVYRILD